MQKQFYETTLPGSIQNNRGGAIYLVESLKSFFEQWYSDAFAKLVVIDFGDESNDHLDDESFVLQTQYFVGGAFRKLQEKFVCPATKKLFANMGFKRHTGDVDEDYIKTYVPEELQHMDRGGLLLIQPAYFPYATALMILCQEAGSKRNRYIRR